LREDLEQVRESPPAVLEAPVSSIMSPAPLSVRRGTPLTEAVDLFADEQVGALPVLDEEDRVVGIVSYVDVMRWLRDRAMGRHRARELEEPRAPH
jgi:CBS-domain-containing membrane protein